MNTAVIFVSSRNQWQQTIMICHLNNHQSLRCLVFVSLTWDMTWHQSVSVLMTYMLGCWSRGLVTFQTFLVLASKQFIMSLTRNLRLVSFAELPPSGELHRIASFQRLFVI